MKIVFRAAVCVLIGTLVLSAPVAEDVPRGPGIDIENGQSDYQRDKRLNTGYYAASPCAAASASNAHVATFVPNTSYQSNIGFTHPSYFTSNYVHPDTAYWYRADDAFKDDREIMRYSDTDFVDQTPMGNILRSAPSSYMNAANLAGLNGQMMQPVKTAYGIFQNANVDSGNVPLLFSCTPSIVHGRLHNPETSFGYEPTQVMVKPTDAYSGLNSHYVHGGLPHTSLGEQIPNDHSSPSSSISSNNLHDK